MNRGERLFFLLRRWRQGRLLRKLVRDAALRQRLILVFSLLFHTSFALFQLIAGLVKKTRWFLALAVYAALLTVVRFFLLRDLLQGTQEQHARAALRRYRFCGIMLLVMSPALIILVAFTVRAAAGTDRQTPVAAVMALYTVSAFFVAAGSIVKAHREHGPLLSAAKSVSLVTASVSLFSLVATILQGVGDAGSLLFRRTVTALLGTVLCALVVTHALGMICRAERALLQHRQAELPP